MLQDQYQRVQEEDRRIAADRARAEPNVGPDRHRQDLEEERKREYQEYLAQVRTKPNSLPVVGRQLQKFWSYKHIYDA